MYTEFLIIYIGLGVLILLVATIIALQLVLIKKLARPGDRSFPFSPTGDDEGAKAKKALGLVTCRRCGMQFDGKTAFCPKCGTPRQQ